MLVGLLVAVAASTCYGVGSVLQVIGARKSARREAASAASGAVLSSRTEYGGPSLKSTAKAAVTWQFMIGTVLDFVGFGLGAVAARMLPLFLSQTIISANLVVTAVLSVKLLNIKLSRPEWTAIGVVCGALVLLGFSAGKEGHPATTTAMHWWLFAASVAMIAVGSAAVWLLGPRGAILAGLLSGLGFGALAIATRVMRGIDPFDLGKLLTDPALYALVVAGAGGMYLHTVALQIGSVNGATAALVVGETVVPGILGVVWLDDTWKSGMAWAAVTGFLLAIAGAVAVAYYGKSELEIAEGAAIAGAAGTAAEPAVRAG